MFFFVFLKIIYINLIDWIFRNQTPPNTPQCIRTAAQRNERDQRLLDSPVYRRTPQIAQLGPPVLPPVNNNNNNDPFLVAPPPGPVYSHLPADLAQHVAALPSLHPTGQRGRRRQLPNSVLPVPAPVPIPVSVPPVPATHYQHLPANLAQQLAELPPLPQHSRGRGRGRTNHNRTNPAPAPLPFGELAAQYTALPPVC